MVDREQLWFYNITKKEWEPKDLFSLYPNLEDNIRGGVRCYQNYTWFFKRRQVWSYNGFKLRDGFPKTINDPLFPVHPTTAINLYNKIFLLKVGYFHFK